MANKRQKRLDQRSAVFDDYIPDLGVSIDAKWASIETEFISNIKGFFINSQELKLPHQSAPNFALIARKTFHSQIKESCPVVAAFTHKHFLLFSSTGRFFLIQKGENTSGTSASPHLVYTLTPDDEETELTEKQHHHFKWSCSFALWLIKTQKNVDSKKTLIVDVELRLNGPDTFQLALNFYLSKKIIYDTYDEFIENLPKEPNTLVTELMHYLYGIESTMKALESTSTQPAMLNVDQFYSRVWEKQVESTVFDDVVLPQNAELIPTLRTFQKSAVKWMIYREKQASELKKYAQSVFVDLPILLGGKEKLY